MKETHGSYFQYGKRLEHYTRQVVWMSLCINACDDDYYYYSYGNNNPSRAKVFEIFLIYNIIIGGIVSATSIISVVNYLVITFTIVFIHIKIPRITTQAKEVIVAMSPTMG